PDLVGTPPVRGRRRTTLGILILTLVAAAVYPDIVAEIMMSGALVMLLSGALTMDQAYGAIDWKSIFLVAGVLPLGTAMVKSGAAQMLATALINTLGGAG